MTRTFPFGQIPRATVWYTINRDAVFFLLSHFSFPFVIRYFSLVTCMLYTYSRNWSNLPIKKDLHLIWIPFWTWFVWTWTSIAQNVFLMCCRPECKLWTKCGIRRNYVLLKRHVTPKLSVVVATTFSCGLLASLSLILYIFVLIFSTYLGVKVWNDSNWGEERTLYMRGFAA